MLHYLDFGDDTVWNSCNKKVPLLEYLRYALFSNGCGTRLPLFFILRKGIYGYSVIKFPGSIFEIERIVKLDT